MDHLKRYVYSTPLEILSEALLEYAQPKTARDVLTAYDGFLSILNDRVKRRDLNELAYEDSDSSPLFDEIRQLGRQFQDGLEALFYDDHAALARLTRTYGLF